MEKEYYLFILVAASAVGKSVLVNQLCEEGAWQKAKKYSTRDNRGEDDDVIKIDDNSITNTPDEQKQTEIRLSRMNKLINLCGEGKGVVYYKNDNIYGVSISEIKEGLKKSHLAVIISDFHAIDKLREQLDCVKVMYIASTIDEKLLFERFKEREQDKYQSELKQMTGIINSIQDKVMILPSAIRLKYASKIDEIIRNVNDKWNTNLSSYQTIKTRSFNIRMLYNRYIDNITKIDYAILNFYGLEYMYKQVRNIIANIHPKKATKQIPPVFMVCAASSSGKATLMEIIGDMGAVHNNIVITKKYAKRDPRPTDGRDGMQAIGKSGNFEDHIEKEHIWQWQFHKRDNTKGIEYAVNHKEIRDNINNSKAQIFISNMGEIENARLYYPNNIVVLYLHATHETETTKHIEAKRRHEIELEIKNSHTDYTDEMIKSEFENNEKTQNKLKTKIEEDKKEIKEVHDTFCEHNVNIDHILLNTGTREDLIEQMTNLINYYTNNTIYSEINLK